MGRAGKREKQRSALLHLITSISISTQKNGARKIPTADESTEKKAKHLPVSLHSHLLDVKMENSSSEDLSEVLQQ